MYIHKLAAALQRVVQHNDAEGHTDTGIARCFRCSKAPPISVKAYILRIAKYSKCSPVCFMMAWSYLKRLTQTEEEIVVTSWTVHRLLITAVMLAAKLMDDKYYNNAFYAKIGGVTKQEINAMELEMLRLLQYRVVVSAGHIKELLMRLDAFQWPGRLSSVLCRKRASQVPESALPQPLAEEHMAKVPRNTLQQPMQMPFTDATAMLMESKANVPNASCNASHNLVIRSGQQSRLSESCTYTVDVSDTVNVKLVQTLNAKHLAECHFVLNCPDTVAVTA